MAGLLSILPSRDLPIMDKVAAMHWIGSLKNCLTAWIRRMQSDNAYALDSCRDLEACLRSVIDAVIAVDAVSSRTERTMRRKVKDVFCSKFFMRYGLFAGYEVCIRLLY